MIHRAAIRPLHRILTAFAVGVGLVANSATAFAQAKTAPAQPVVIPKPEKLTLKTSDVAALRSVVSPQDQTELGVTYYRSVNKKDAAVVLLLHGRGGNRLVWEKPKGNLPALADYFQQSGFAVVTVDLRGHGDTPLGSSEAGKTKGSGKVDLKHYKLMSTLDLDRVKQLLFEEHQAGNLNMERLAIVAADMSTVVAMWFADHDWQKSPYDDAPTPAASTPRGQDVKSLVLLSPENEVDKALSVSQPIGRLKGFGVRFMLLHGKADKLDKGAYRKVTEWIAPKSAREKDPERYDFLQLIELDTPLRGTDMLYKNIPYSDGKSKPMTIEQYIAVTLDEQLNKKNKIEWRDRRSRLERDGSR